MPFQLEGPGQGKRGQIVQLSGTLITCPAFSAPGKSKEAEIKRINKELANIRSKFKGRLEA